MSRLAVLGGVLLAAGCGDGGGDALDIAPQVLTDMNPDPAIVEVELVASVGTQEYLSDKPADVWAYRSGAPRADRRPRRSCD